MYAYTLRRGVRLTPVQSSAPRRPYLGELLPSPLATGPSEPRRQVHVRALDVTDGALGVPVLNEPADGATVAWRPLTCGELRRKKPRGIARIDGLSGPARDGTGSRAAQSASGPGLRPI